jgi:ferredoxin
VEKVFLAGEVATGPGAAVEAVASGHRTAAAVLKFLGVEAGEKVAKLPEGKVEPDVTKIPKDVLEKMPKKNRLASPMRDAHARVGSFDEVEDTLTEMDVRKEVARCVACGLGAEADEDKCVGCYTCVRICPYGVATMEKTAAKMPAEACLTCGICASECPAAAISIERFRTRSVGERVEAALKNNSKAGIVVIACQSAFGSRALMRMTPADKQAGAVKVIVPCVQRLSAADMMAPFEKGAKRAVIVHCGDACVYPEGKGRFEQRVKRTLGLLKAAKVDENAVSVWYGRIDTEDDLRKVYAAPAVAASGEAGKA